LISWNYLVSAAAETGQNPEGDLGLAISYIYFQFVTGGACRWLRLAELDPFAFRAGVV
jgi:hypothetical protein